MVLQFTVKLMGGVRLDKETNVFVSRCPALDLYSQGTSEDEAVRALSSAIHLFLTTCFERDILGEVLKQRGFSAMTGMGALLPNQFTEEFIQITGKDKYEAFPIEVPFNLVAQASTVECQPSRP